MSISKALVSFCVFLRENFLYTLLFVSFLWTVYFLYQTYNSYLIYRMMVRIQTCKSVVEFVDISLRSNSDDVSFIHLIDRCLGEKK